MFRTWIIRQGNTVRVRKLTEMVISLWLEIIKLDKEWFNVILLYGTILEYHIWNKWKCMSVNKWLTLISYQCMKKGSSQQQQTRQISTVNFILVTLMSAKLFMSVERILRKCDAEKTLILKVWSAEKCKWKCESFNVKEKWKTAAVGYWRQHFISILAMTSKVHNILNLIIFCIILSSNVINMLSPSRC